MKKLNRVLPLFVILTVWTLLSWAPPAWAQPRLNLTWDDNSTNEDGFRIERRLDVTGTYAEIFVTGPNVTAYQDLNVLPGTNYCYRVRAYNVAGVSGYTNEDCEVPRDIPADPSNAKVKQNQAPIPPPGP